MVFFSDTEKSCHKRESLAAQQQDSADNIAKLKQGTEAKKRLKHHVVKVRLSGNLGL